MSNILTIADGFKVFTQAVASTGKNSKTMECIVAAMILAPSEDRIKIGLTSTSPAKIRSFFADKLHVTDTQSAEYKAIQRGVTRGKLISDTMPLDLVKTTNSFGQIVDLASQFREPAIAADIERRKVQAAHNEAVAAQRKEEEAAAKLKADTERREREHKAKEVASNVEMTIADDEESRLAAAIILIEHLTDDSLLVLAAALNAEMRARAAANHPAALAA